MTKHITFRFKIFSDEILLTVIHRLREFIASILSSCKLLLLNLIPSEMESKLFVFFRNSNPTMDRIFYSFSIVRVFKMDMALGHAPCPSLLTGFCVHLWTMALWRSNCLAVEWSNQIPFWIQHSLLNARVFAKLHTTGLITIYTN